MKSSLLLGVLALASLCLAAPNHGIPIDFPDVPPTPPLAPCRLPGGGPSPGRECFLDNSDPRQCVQYCDLGKPGVFVGVEPCTDPLPTECTGPWVAPTGCSCAAPVELFMSAVLAPMQVRCYEFCTCVIPDPNYRAPTFGLPGDPCAFCGPVPAGCWCDPHFKTLYGKKKYDFQGQVDTVFNIVSDPTFQINIFFAAASRHSDILADRETWIGPANVTRETWLGVAGFQTGQDKLTMDAETCVPVFNGEDVTDSEGGSEYMQYSHRMMGDFEMERGHLTVRTARWEVLVVCKWVTRAEKHREERYLNLEVLYEGTGDRDNIPDGVLGQTAAKRTYRPEPDANQGEGVIKGVWQDYIVHDNTVFGTDYKYRQFNADNVPEVMSEE